MQPFVFFKTLIIYGGQTIKDMLQPTRLLKRSGRCEKLSTVAKVSEDVAKKWLVKQAIWQIYLPAPRYIPRPKFDVSLPNAVHQADLLFLPHDKLPHGKKIYKYALTVVDAASRYKAAELLTSKESDEVSKAFQRIYKRGPLKWPQLLQVDPGREFMGSVTKVMQNNKTSIRRRRTEYIETKRLWKDSTEPWLNGCLAISMQLR